MGVVARTPAVVLGFLDAMQDAYAAADLAVSRSGAVTVAELAIAGLPSVLVPLQTLARGDQEANARVLERAGAARGRPAVRSGASPSAWPTRSSALLGDAALRAADVRRAHGRSRRPDAAERLADVVESVV